MGKYKKIVISIIFVLAILIVPTVYLAYFSTSSKINRDRLHRNIRSLNDDQEICLEEIADFDWTSLYVFESDVNKDIITDTIGFQSDFIRDTRKGKGLQLVFVNGKAEVTCYINDAFASLELDFRFNKYKICKKFNRNDKDKFIVKKDQNQTHLKYN